MYDYVRSEIPLPDEWEGELQTQDFDCDMTTVVIRADGTLEIERREWVAAPIEERLHPNAEGPLAFAGCIKAVNSRWEKLDYHGDMNFYGVEVVGKKPPNQHGHELPIYKSHDYIARFTEGKLKWIRLSS